MMKFLLVFVLLFITFSSLARTLFFESNGQEVQIQYKGTQYDITAVTFVFECSPSYCDPNDKQAEVLKDFFNSIANDKIYYYEAIQKPPVGGSCEGFGPCISVKSISPSVKTQHRQNKKLFNNFLKSFINGLGEEAGKLSAERAMELAFPSNDGTSKVGDVTFTIITVDGGNPIAMCLVTPNGCEVINEIEFTNFKNRTVVEHHSVDMNEAIDRIVQNQLQEFMHKIFASCRYAYTGPSGDTKIQLVCF